MPGEIAPQVVFIRSRSIAVRAGIIVAILIALLFGWYTFSRMIGNMMAEITAPTDLNAKATAYAATWMAPSDPLSNWLLATTENDSFLPEKAQATVKNFEKLVRLAPYDYRWWIELGRAREQMEDAPGAEKALLRAIELAPTYTYPHWQLGNFYLRQGRTDEAFVQLKMAAENNAFYREQVFYIAWEFFNQDKAQLEKIVGNSPQIQATLAKFYSTHEQPDASVAIWESLTPEQREENRPIGLVIMQTMFERKFYRAAVYFVKAMGRDDKAQVGQIQNGNFEDPVRAYGTEYPYFDWSVADKDKISIRQDTAQKHEGKSSLRVNFNAFTAQALSNVTQFVAVEPGARYTLTFWVKTENLKSAGPPYVEVVGINETRGFGATPSFPIGNNDWQQMRIDFTVPEDIDGVMVRTVRQYCGENCPLIGTIWYDDFQLQKISGDK